VNGARGALYASARHEPDAVKQLFNKIPIIDIGDIDQAAGAGIESIVQQIYDAYTTAGFAYIVDHGIDSNLVAALFEASAAFHALPRASRMAIELNALHRGFIPINTSTDRNSRFAVVTEPNQSESFIMMREADANDPCVLAGDYLAGPNHVLPTGGTARFFSPLGVDDFLKRTSITRFEPPKLRELGLDVMRLSQLEGLGGHGHSVDLRLQKIRRARREREAAREAEAELEL